MLPASAALPSAVTYVHVSSPVSYTHLDVYKRQPFHPCKGVGVIEYSGFAREIDRRIQCACLSCYPEVTDDTCCCKWAFSIPE